MILKQAMRVGKIPPQIANAPELRLGLELYYAAFYDLVHCRTGWGDGPIALTSILEYAKVYDFDEEQTEDLIYYVTRLDETYLGYLRNKKPGKTTAANAPPAMGKTK